MEISGASSSVYLSASDRPVANRKPLGNAPDDKQDTVSISPEASQAYAAEDKPSAAKLFAYGALGLQRPDATTNKPTDGYDVGRWLAAGLEVGTIISVLV